jgi:hypothetical protein
MHGQVVVDGETGVVAGVLSQVRSVLSPLILTRSHAPELRVGIDYTDAYEAVISNMQGMYCNIFLEPRISRN